jgi:CubicO group peptidase (beta-lactamase class C family)
MSTLPEDVGCSSTRLQRINSFMQTSIDQRRIAGVVMLVARHGTIVHAASLGRQDIEANMPMQPDTIFSIQSMTKLITCVAALMLYEDGQLQLDDPVTQFIPAFNAIKVLTRTPHTDFAVTDLERPITIHDLLTHTAGITHGFLRDDSPVEEMYRHAQLQAPGITLQEIVQRLAQLPLVHQPGQGWRYGHAHDVLAHVVEIISGQSFDAFLKQRIFAPLDMEDTGFCVPAPKMGRLAAVYRPAEQGELERIPAAERRDYTCPQPPIGGSGLVSTASDYMRFAQLLLNGGILDSTRLLGRKTVELMTMNHLPRELLPYAFDPLRPTRRYTRGYGYGLGVRVVMDLPRTEMLGSIGAYGWGGSDSTFVTIDPKEGIIGLLMAQVDPLDFLLERQFMTFVYQALSD